MPLRDQLHALLHHLNHRVIGQPGLCQRLVIALLADGHLLVEGAPGLAKTRAIGSLAGAIAADFHRIQFTPDLLPSDITGSDIYRPETGSFSFQPGPLFHNLVLADEINRAPAKVQAALLEAMGERQISVGAKTYPLPSLFLVMATQNPIEQEGTYPLPEAQLDRFLLHVLVDYPDVAAERRILALARDEAAGTMGTPFVPLAQDVIFAARRETLAVHMDPAVEEYLVQLILATRNTKGYGANLKNWIEYGASPRATIALDRCARVMAWLDDRDYVTPDDIRDIAPDVLRHRILLNFEAEAEGVTTSQAIAQLLTAVPSA
jgi:MoxR-like ATPase